MSYSIRKRLQFSPIMEIKKRKMDSMSITKFYSQVTKIHTRSQIHTQPNTYNNSTLHKYSNNVFKHHR